MDRRDDVVTGCRILDGEGLTDAFGHLSARADGDELHISPKLGPGLVTSPEQLLRMNLSGEVIEGDVTLMPAEAALHRGILRARRDVMAVARFHGAACMAWSTLDRPLPTTIAPALALGAGVPVFDTTRTIVSDEQADAVAAALGDGSAVLLRGFGAVTVGRSVAEAVVRAHALERSAAAVLAASAVSEPLAYPPLAARELAAGDAALTGQIQRAWTYMRRRHVEAVSPEPAPPTANPEQEEPLQMTSDSIWLALMGNGVRERLYDAAGIRTRVLEAGSGPPLVLLHGTGGHAETYYRNIVPLSRFFRVLAADMVGHGLSDLPDDVDYSLDAFADHLEHLLDAAGIDRAHISGESLGAAVAAWFAITRPERVDRLVLNTAVLAHPTPEGLAELEEFARRTIEVMSGGFTLEAVRTRMEWLVAEPSRMTEELVSCRYAIYGRPRMLETVAKVMMSVGGMFRGTTNRQYFEPGVMGRIRCPTLVLWTEHNPGQSAEFAERVVADIPDHEFRVLTDCGHWPQFESPDEFNRLHVEFLTAEKTAAAR
jgi:2-hydroxy-6-oxonona-2,4-dienedioate hydrolase